MGLYGYVFYKTNTISIQFYRIFTTVKMNRPIANQGVDVVRCHHIYPEPSGSSSNIQSDCQKQARLHEGNAQYSIYIIKKEAAIPQWGSWAK